MRAVLSRAAIDDPALRAAYLACGRAVRAADPADYALMRLMPPEVRPACWALRAATGSHVAAPTLAAPAGASPGGDSPGGRAGTGTDPATDPVRTALADCVRRWNLNPQELHPPPDSADGHGHGPATWQQWRTCARQRRRLLWLEQVLLVLSRHGVPVYGWLLRQENFESGLHLTDALAYLSDDITRGRLTLPAEVLDAFPTAAPALLERRWTPAVHALVAHLAGQARRWLRRPPLAHPGLAVLLRTTTRLCLARLDAVEAAGPALLHHTPRPALPVRLRIVTPAQALAVAAWRIAPLTAPPAVRGPRPSAAAALIPAQARHDRTGVPAPRPPLPHHTGVRPPRLPAGRMPRHVAVIMDGNGRWATRRGLPRSEGHRVGAQKALRDVVHGALEIGLPHLTVYAFSTENWKRDLQEIAFLLHTIREDLNGEAGAKEWASYGVRLRWAGDSEGLPTDVVEDLARGERATRHCTRLTLTTCVNYGGRAELTRAAARLARAARDGDIDADRIGTGEFTRHLSLPDLPDVDLLWRTGGEQRTSNFLPWHATYAELHFTDTHWPDVDRRDLWRAVTEYGRRQRRYGAVVSNAQPS